MLPEKNILNIEAPPGYDKIYFFLNKVTGRQKVIFITFGGGGRGSFYSFFLGLEMSF